MRVQGTHRAGIGRERIGSPALVALACLGMAALPPPATAGETAAFLKVGVGARPAAMGGAYTAIAEDALALAWNPAGLSGLSRRELGAMHAELAAGTRFDFVGYAHPLGRGSLGLGAVHLRQGSIEGRDASGRPAGSYGASDTALSAAYSARLGEGWRLGGTLKWVRSGVADASAQTLALDAGMMRDLDVLGPGRLRAGLAVLNLGPGMRFLGERSELPLTVSVGLSYALPLGLTLAADARRRVHGRSTELGVGTEYAILPVASLRLGYATGSLGGSPGVDAPGTSRAGLAGAGSLSGLGAGFGIRLSAYTVDYSFTPLGELGNAQRFSLGVRF